MENHIVRQLNVIIITTIISIIRICWRDVGVYQIIWHLVSEPFVYFLWWDLATRAWRPLVTQRQLSVFVYNTEGVVAALGLK